MRAQEISSLLSVGAYDRIRKKLKRLAILERMNSLNSCFHLINSTPANLKFFKENFSIEIGALLVAERDGQKATELYNNSLKK